MQVLCRTKALNHPKPDLRRPMGSGSTSRPRAFPGFKGSPATSRMGICSKESNASWNCGFFFLGGEDLPSLDPNVLDSKFPMIKRHGTLSYSLSLRLTCFEGLELIVVNNPSDYMNSLDPSYDSKTCLPPFSLLKSLRSLTAQSFSGLPCPC